MIYPYPIKREIQAQRCLTNYITAIHFTWPQLHNNKKEDP